MYNENNNPKLQELIEGIKQDLSSKGGVVHFGDNINSALYPDLSALINVINKINGKPISGYVEDSGTKTPDKLYLSKTLQGTFTPKENTTSVNPNDSVWVKSGIDNKVNKTGDTMSGNLTLNANLAVSSGASIKGGLAVSGGITVSDNGIVVNGNGTFNNAVAIKQTLGVTGVSTFTGQTIHNGGIDVNGAADISTTLTVGGNTTLKGTLAVTGAITATGGVAGNASTATTLQTARTINGTSFNGSTDITTTNWGTARTITIGNSGKSVDGSVSVSYSLSDIGAFPVDGGTMTGNLVGNSSHTISGFGKVYNAVWNDYAEFYERGEGTEPGDVIAIDLISDKEIYVKASKEKGNTCVVGVHSNTFAHLIGGEEPPKDKDFYDYNIGRFIPVGLAGRVMCKITGAISKGDYVTLSNIDGVGEMYVNGIHSPTEIFGIALETNLEPEIKLVKIQIKR